MNELTSTETGMKPDSRSVQSARDQIVDFLRRELIGPDPIQPGGRVERFIDEHAPLEPSAPIVQSRACQAHSLLHHLLSECQRITEIP